MDQDYISKVVAGDTNAFKYLVNKYKDVMLATAYRIVKDQDLAEDVLQDAFFNAYRNLKKFKGDAKFSTWLYKIVVNAAIKKIRKGEHLKENENAAQVHLVEEAYESSLNSLKSEEQTYYIDLTFQKMVAREALVLQLFYLNELSLKEVAEVMQIKVDHVKVLLYRARKQFQILLAEELKHEVKSII